MLELFLANTINQTKINDTGRKTLYLIRNNNYEWEILTEIWNKLNDNESAIISPIAFKPSMRFFTPPSNKNRDN